MLPDHGREIDKYEFSDLDKFTRHLERASDTVATWPAWKRKLLDNNPTRETPRVPRVPIDTERSHDDISRRLSLQKVELLGDRPRVVLPPSDYFYDRAMKRSAEIKAKSAAEIMQEAGVPNMLENRPLKFNCQGATTGRTVCSTPVLDSKFEARFKALQERYDELERKLSERERKESSKLPNRLEGRQLYGPCRGCQRSGTACHTCEYGGP